MRYLCMHLRRGYGRHACMYPRYVCLAVRRTWGLVFLAEGGSAGGDVPGRLRAPASLGNSVHTLIVV